MLAKRYHLPIQNFLGKKGRVIKTPYFLLKIFPAEQLSSRFGIVISRKVFKKAVDRNRLKRRIFNFLREIKDKLPLADYLIIVSPAAAQLNNFELRNWLSKNFSNPVTNN
jgi:ribonuclease P protein component